MQRISFTRGLILMLALVTAGPTMAQTQGDGARLYWKTLAGANAITFWPTVIGGNANPMDPTHNVSPDVDARAELALVGVHKVLPIAGRSSTLSLLVPVGHVSGTITTNRGAQTQTSRGFGDPMLQADINLIGAPAMRNLVDFSRYEPRFTMDFLGAVALPIGEYSDTQSVNLGQNRWYGRIGAPMMIGLAPWVPGQCMTLEFLPAVWLFGDVDQGAGKVLKNSSMLQLEGHFTRDLTTSAWVSLDASMISGSKPKVGPIEMATSRSSGVGFTFGFQVTPGLSINTSYFATVADKDATDLRGDEFRVSFSYGWHKLTEGIQRLGNK